LSSCAEGTCGTCETAVLGGRPDHRDSVLTEEERRAGDCMMICVSRSCTARLVLDLQRGLLGPGAAAYHWYEVGHMGAERVGVEKPAAGTSPVRLQRCGDHPCPSSGCQPDESVLRRSPLGALAPGRVPDSVVAVLRSPGSPLPSTVRQGMEQRFGHDFSQVRVHTDEPAARSAMEVQARAYTVGSHVVFGAGQYQPASDRGNHLLAHELTHVVQQGGGPWSPDRAGTFAVARAAADRIGRQLWTAATGAAKAGRTDDRPLYWARVQLTRTIRQAQPSFRLTEDQRATLIDTFDRASRGMTTAQFGGKAGVKRVVISGFDPFGMNFGSSGGTRVTNPSGAAALALDGRTLTNGTVRGQVESVVFPVSFGAFDARMVESFFRPFLTGPRHADMIMTISMGGSDFKVEQYAGRTRGAGTPDNLDVTPSQPGAPPGAGPGPEFIQGSLPGSVRGALGRPPTAGETTVTEIPAGQTSPVTSVSGPTPGSTAVAGSGGDYLSNEIFYRVGLLQLTEGTKIPFGHLHVPRLSPDMSDLAVRRDQVVRQVEQILTAALPDP
jgi:pyrrolidone-carboxylate peptidase